MAWQFPKKAGVAFLSFRNVSTLSWLGVILTAGIPAHAEEHVLLRRDGQQRLVEGRVLVEARDGGVLLESRDGVYWVIPPEQMEERKTLGVSSTFDPLSHRELEEKLLESLPAGFATHTTKRYVIAYDTSRSYAIWCGSLFERLYSAFTNYWSGRRVELHEPEVPLVAIIFADRRTYIRHATEELGSPPGNVVGYYNLLTNRVTMFDLTGAERFSGTGRHRGNRAAIQRILSQPGAAKNVATIVHEATHQVAYNCGLQTRFADIPLWVSEGLATYFETPDVQSNKGWRRLGGVNQDRLRTFLQYLPQRDSDSLPSLLRNDERFRDQRQAVDAYAEAWALNYFLLRQKADLYTEYLRMLKEKPQLVQDAPETRLEEFQSVFGQDLARLDEEFIRYLLRVR